MQFYDDPALSEMFRTMTAIGNGSFAGNRFTARLSSVDTGAGIAFLCHIYTLSRPVSMDALSGCPLVRSGQVSPPPFCCAFCMAIVRKTAVSGIPVRPLPQW